MKTESEVFERFHAALNADPTPGAYERLRAVLVHGAASKSSSPRQHLAVAASFVAALLVVIGLLVVRNEVTPAVGPAGPAAISPPAIVTSIGETDFINQQTGWTVVRGDLSENTAAYRTDDGGSRWTRKHILGSPAPVSYHHFFDGRNGIVVSEAWLGTGYPAILFRTSDGGDSWVRTNLPTGFAYFAVSFVSPSEGWLLGLNLDHPESQAPPLFKTTDGGVTWTELGIISEPHQGVVWLQFTDSRNGVIESTALGQMPHLLTTDDGGVSWHASTVAAPPSLDLTHRWVSNFFPAYFGGGRGVLIVGVSDPGTSGYASHLYTYTTTDQGAHWEKPLAAPAGQHPAGVRGTWTSDHWWFAQDRYVVTSTNSGRSWLRREIDLPTGFYLRAVAFSDSEHGWAVVTDRIPDNRAGARHEVLLTTDDGGAHWRQLPIPRPSATP